MTKEEFLIWEQRGKEYTKRKASDSIYREYSKLKSVIFWYYKDHDWDYEEGLTIYHCWKSINRIKLMNIIIK